ncbi:MAG: hypothetical protein ABSD52_00970 [Candidatus Cybelea sp.]|jgi:hypothetical protein
MRRIFLTGVIAAALLAPCAASAEIVPAFGITIQSCVVNSNGGGLTNGVNMVYYNTHPSSATEVDFLVRYHGHAYVLTDRGTFTQNAQINHNLANSLVGRSWQGPNAKLCTVQRVYLENGKVLQ